MSRNSNRAIGGENLVRRRIPKPREPTAGNFEGQQSLITIGNITFGLRANLGRELIRSLHVIECQNVGISGRGSSNALQAQNSSFWLSSRRGAERLVVEGDWVAAGGHVGSGRNAAYLSDPKWKFELTRLLPLALLSRLSRKGQLHSPEINFERQPGQIRAVCDSEQDFRNAGGRILQ
jgi:hypothetical protein